MRFLVILMLAATVVGLAYGEDEKSRKRRNFIECSHDGDCGRNQICEWSENGLGDRWSRCVHGEKPRNRRGAVSCRQDSECWKYGPNSRCAVLGGDLWGNGVCVG
ncbi:unnamed protein product, partial [Mesorhabditis spiculigera]